VGYKTLSAILTEREITGDEEGLNIKGGRIEEVNEFCYQGNVLDCEAGVERAERTERARVMLRGKMEQTKVFHSR